MTVRDALNSALDEEMSADPKVFVMGEEVQWEFLFKISKMQILPVKRDQMTIGYSYNLSW